MSTLDDATSGLKAAQLARLRRARWRWGLSILLGGFAFLGVVMVFTGGSLSRRLAAVFPFGVFWTMAMAVVVPLTQLSTDPTKGSTAMRRLVIEDPSDVRRVVSALRRRLPLHPDDEVVAQAWVLETRERIQVCGLLIGLSLLLVLVLSMRSRLIGGSFPWAVSGCVAVVIGALLWRVVRLSRLLGAARERGIVVREPRT